MDTNLIGYEVKLIDYQNEEYHGIIIDKDGTLGGEYVVLDLNDQKVYEVDFGVMMDDMRTATINGDLVK